MNDLILNSTTAVALENKDKLEILKSSLCSDLSQPEFKYFIEVCKAQMLNPFNKQIYAIKRNTRNGPVINIQTGIDGYRLIAARSGAYAGSSEPVFNGEVNIQEGGGKKAPESASITIKKIVGGIVCDFTSTVYWEELFPGPKMGFQWKKMPKLMLSKCFDAETEILTENGFVKFTSLKNEKVYQVEEDGMSLVKPKKLKKRYTGNMVTVDSDDLNFSVTPNHDMVTSVGKMEARAMLSLSRSRKTITIPRFIDTDDIYDPNMWLIGAILSDGHIRGNRATISVSKARKINMLDKINKHISKRNVPCAGAISKNSIRAIRTKKDQTAYVYDISKFKKFMGSGKSINIESFNKLQSHRCRQIVKSLIFFDGTNDKISNTFKFYSSNKVVCSIFEVLAVKGGFSISTRKKRISDISSKTNYYYTVSHRNHIGVYKNKTNSSIKTVKNKTNHVYCVTVPSGKIVVRRNGFSMICGNCAESAALRKAFPAELSGLNVEEEMQVVDQENDVIEAESKVVEKQADKDYPKMDELVASIEDGFSKITNGTMDGNKWTILEKSEFMIDKMGGIGKIQELKRFTVTELDNILKDMKQYYGDNKSKDGVDQGNP